MTIAGETAVVVPGISLPTSSWLWLPCISSSNYLLGPMTPPQVLEYSAFKTKVAEGQILTAVIGQTPRSQAR